MVIRELITLLGFDLKDGPLQKYDKEIDRTKAKSNALANAGRGIGIAYKVAAVAVAAGIGWISKNIIASTVEMEAYRTQIQAFTGNAEDAAAALADLRDKTVDPLFGTGTLVSAYKQLRTVGMGAQDTSKMIDVLGDVANGSAENFSALSGVLTNVATTGKVNERTIKQLTNAGFGLNDMAQGLGVSVEKLNADISSGKIGFNELSRAMEGATKEGGRFYMNAANQAMTLGGSIKILKSLISDIGEAIGSKVAPTLANLLGYVTNLIKLGKNGLVNFGAKAFDYLIHVIAQVIIFFEVLQMRMKKYGGAFTPLKEIFRDVFGFLRTIVESARPALINLAQLILVAFKPLRAFVQPILEALKPIIRSVFGTLSGILSKLIPIVDGLTPLFGGLGKAIGGLLGPILGVAVAIKGINSAIAIGKGAVAGIKAIQQAYGLLTGTMSVMKAAAEGNRLAMIMLDAQMIKSKIITLAKAAATKIAAAATQIWSGIQAVFNAIMAANPIALIIIGVIALIAAIVLLVKNWDKVGPAIMNAFSVIGNFFKKLWGVIVGTFQKIVAFVKNNALNIANVLLAILFLPAGIIMAVVRLIIKHWDKIKPALLKIFKAVANSFSKIWNGIKQVALKVWDGIKNAASSVFESIKAAWQGITGFFSGLWGSIKDITASVWNGIKNIFWGVVNSIKNIWLGIVGFFSGLWEALKQGPSEALDYIKNAFFDLFENIKNKFLGFISIIKEGWEKVKGFFGGIKEAVVNVVTNSDNPETTKTKPVNDMIVTPEGQYSTHPDDYIMAMKNPSEIIDALMRFLGGPQLAYAGSGGGSLTESAMKSATSTHNTYHSTSNESNVSAPITVNVNANGMSPEMASAAVRRGVEEALNDAISGSRGSIPSPEKRRNQ